MTGEFEHFLLFLIKLFKILSTHITGYISNTAFILIVFLHQIMPSIIFSVSNFPLMFLIAKVTTYIKQALEDFLPLRWSTTKTDKKYILQFDFKLTRLLIKDNNCCAVKQKCSLKYIDDFQ